MHSGSFAHRPLSRRGLLAGSVAAAALAGGCHSRSGGGSDAAQKKVPLPAYVPRELVRPDLAGDPNGVEPAYLRYPRRLVSSRDRIPSGWGSMTSLVLTWNAPPPPMSKNSYWQAVNDHLGGSIETTLVPAADYDEKLSAVFAGGDLPDTMLMTGGQLTLPRLPELLQAKFFDLSDLLSGNAVKNYPNLANIPTYSWRSARIAGRIWGVPIQQSMLTNGFMARADILKDVAGADVTDIRTTEDLLSVCKEVTSQKQSRWALGPTEHSLMVILGAAFGAPNNWGQDDDGTLVKDWETDEFIDALDFYVQLRKKGYIHPDAVGMAGSQAADAFKAGHSVLYVDGVGGWRGWVEEMHRPLDQLDVLGPITAAGAEPAYYLSPGLIGVTMFRKDEEEKIHDRLAIANALAAPFGTTESRLIDYGVKDKDYEMDGGEPVITAKGLLETKNGMAYVGARPRVLYSGASPEWARKQHAWETRVAPAGLPDPTVGAYSATASRSASAAKTVDDTLTDVVAGRKTVADFRSAVQDWVSQYGDDIRGELRDSLS